MSTEEAFAELLYHAVLKRLRHLQPNTLKCFTYHGQTRKGVESLDQYDVIITTYYTLSAIWRKRAGHPEDENSIFSLTWHRVVLNEGEIIQSFV